MGCDMRGCGEILSLARVTMYTAFVQNLGSLKRWRSQVGWRRMNINQIRKLSLNKYHIPIDKH